MFELIEVPHPGQAVARAVARYAPPSGPGAERRAPAAQSWRLMAAAIDEIDYGMLLVEADAAVLHLNCTARATLDDGHPLQLLDGALAARRTRDAALLRGALAAATRGLRRMLALGEPGRVASVSVVPLAGGDAAAEPVTLVVLGRREVCSALAVQGFAQAAGLTPGESRVLAALCAGVPPGQIAAAHGVELCTVRSQIGAIRTKTGAASIRELVRLVASLPPLMSVLRGGGGAAAAVTQ